MTEILDVLKMRIEESHQLYHRIGIALPLIFILDGQQVFDHFLNVPSILTHDEVIPRGIVFHTFDIHHIHEITVKSSTDKLSCLGGAREAGRTSLTATRNLQLPARQKGKTSV